MGKLLYAQSRGGHIQKMVFHKFQNAIMLKISKKETFSSIINNDIDS